jgi:hypothetical protein
MVNKVKKRSDAEAAVPPALIADHFERHEGLRETTLAVFTEDRLNAALRVLGEELFLMALEYRLHWPVEPEGRLRHLARAGLADLRHLQGFFAAMGREREASELTSREDRLSLFCEQLALRIQETANELERELGD